MGTMSSHWPTRFCAESPPRRARQLTGDVVAVLLLLGCLWIGNGVHDLTNQLAGPAGRWRRQGRAWEIGWRRRARLLRRSR